MTPPAPHIQLMYSVWQGSNTSVRPSEFPSWSEVEAWARPVELGVAVADQAELEQVLDGWVPCQATPRGVGPPRKLRTHPRDRGQRPVRTCGCDCGRPRGD